MKTRSSTLIGTLFVVIGLLAFSQATILPMLGINLAIWHFWPLLPLAGSLFMLAAPILFSGDKGLRGMFIPAMPLVVISTMLFIGSVFGWWGVWATFWPAILIGLGLGFVFSAIGMRNIDLMIPAVIIGANGALFQFTSLTGWWGSWAILWTLEPIIVGIGLFIASAGVKRDMIQAGLILSVISLATLSFMSFIMSGWFSVVGAVLLIGVGSSLMLRGRWPQEKQLLEKQPDIDFIQEKAPQEEFVI